MLWFRCIPSWQVRKTHHEFYFNWVYTSLPEITKSLADSDAVEEEDRQTQNVPDQTSLTALHCFICFVVSYLLSPDACTSSEFGAASIVSFSCQSYLQNSLKQPLLWFGFGVDPVVLVAEMSVSVGMQHRVRAMCIKWRKWTLVTDVNRSLLEYVSWGFSVFPFASNQVRFLFAFNMMCAYWIQVWFFFFFFSLTFTIDIECWWHANHSQANCCAVVSSTG